MRLLLSWQQGGLSGADQSPTELKTLFLVTHKIQQALEVAEYFIFLHCGKLVGGKAFHANQLPRANGTFDVSKISRAINDGVVEGF